MANEKTHNETFRFELEDDTGFILLEDGTGYLVQDVIAPVGVWVPVENQPEIWTKVE